MYDILTKDGGMLSALTTAALDSIDVTTVLSIHRRLLPIYINSDLGPLVSAATSHVERQLLQHDNTSGIQTDIEQTPVQYFAELDDEFWLCSDLRTAVVFANKLDDAQIFRKNMLTNEYTLIILREDGVNWFLSSVDEAERSETVRLTIGAVDAAIGERIA